MSQKPPVEAALPDRLPVRRALLSVYRKDGVVELARALREHGAELLSTGGTRQVLRAAGLPVLEVSEYTGFPEMLDGRVKTLHPMIHGGLLGRRDRPEHLAMMERFGIGPIDLVCVNLYPFAETAAGAGAARQEIIEQIDIGGPSMIRSAAKNHDAVAVLCDPADYPGVIAELDQGGVCRATRRRLAAAAFARTASYDQAIAAWFAADREPADGLFPDFLCLSGVRLAELRYGENPHQRGAFYADEPRRGLGAAEPLPGGKELSYNNYLDLDAAIAAAGDLPAPAAVVVKHTNPCGAALGGSSAQALQRAWEGDPVSAFGSVVAVHGRFDAACAEYLTSGGKFVEAVAAAEFEPAAVELLRGRPKWGPNLRLMRVAELGQKRRQWEARRLWGGTLVQESDAITAFEEEWRQAGAVALAPDRAADARLAQTVAKHLKSNAVCLVKDGMLVGAGAGQMSRVDAARLAVEKAGERARGAVAGSDAFFPFPDGVLILAAAGVAAVVQPGGSVKDAEVTAAADRHGVAMLHTGVRHFRH